MLAKGPDPAQVPMQPKAHKNYSPKFLVLHAGHVMESFHYESEAMAYARRHTLLLGEMHAVVQVHYEYDPSNYQTVTITTYSLQTRKD